MGYILLDDTSTNLACGHTLSLQCNYSSVYSNSWLNGTAVTSANGPVTLTFSGITAAFYASGIFNQTANATISVDGQKAVMSISSFKDPWYSTKTLRDGQHNITFENLPDGFVIDYMAITPGNDTSLVGNQLIVDDTDPSLVYTGQWTRNTTTTLPVHSEWEILNPEVSNYNTTSFGSGFQETEDPRASVNFTFTGTSVSVYGFYDHKYPPLPATFTIDGKDEHTSFGVSYYLEQANYLWFESGGLSPGSHVLMIAFGDPFSSILNGPGGRFTLDYIVYVPSFSSLATQGDSVSAASSTIQTPFSTKQISLPTTSSATSHSEKSSVLIGAPVGTVVGLLLVTCLVFVFRRIAMKKIQAIARLIPDPYRNVPNSSVVSPDSHTMPIVESRKGAPSTAQGRSTDVAPVLPPDRSLPILSEPSSVGVRVHSTDVMAVNRAQRIQELANELQQEIVVGGRLVSPAPRPTGALRRDANT